MRASLLSTRTQYEYQDTIYSKADPLVWDNIEVLEDTEKLADNCKKIRKWQDFLLLLSHCLSCLMF